MSIYINPPKSNEQSDYRAEKPKSFHFFAELLSESSHPKSDPYRTFAVNLKTLVSPCF